MSVKRIEQYRWRIQWAGRWKVTSYYATEEEIRVEHPEAERVEESRRIIEVPEDEGGPGHGTGVG